MLIVGVSGLVLRPSCLRICHPTQPESSPTTVSPAALARWQAAFAVARARGWTVPGDFLDMDVAEEGLTPEAWRCVYPSVALSTVCMVH